jgi:ketosteroid isomerase-like protein
MSRSNEQVALDAYAAWSRADFDGWLAVLDDDIEFHTSGYFPDFAPLYRGHEGMARFWEDMRAPWAHFRIELDRYVEGGDRAATAVRFIARGAGSGADVELEFGHALRFRGGRIASLAAFRSFEEALDDAGLRDLAP